MIRPEIRERFLRDAVPVRLGNLASNLSRLASCARRPAQWETVLTLLSESERFIEWTGPEAADALQPELVRVQVELAWWGLRWPKVHADVPEQERLATQARSRADFILEQSGLLGADA